MNKLSKNVVSFTEYNILGVPCEGRDIGYSETKNNICGHYNIFLNTKTKQYLVTKEGDFGGFTWYPKSEDEAFLVLDRFEKAMFDNIIEKRSVKIEKATPYCLGVSEVEVAIAKILEAPNFKMNIDTLYEAKVKSWQERLDYTQRTARAYKRLHTTLTCEQKEIWGLNINEVKWKRGITADLNMVCEVNGKVFKKWYVDYKASSVLHLITENDIIVFVETSNITATWTDAFEALTEVYFGYKQDHSATWEFRTLHKEVKLFDVMNWSEPKQRVIPTRIVSEKEIEHIVDKLIVHDTLVEVEA